MIFNIPLHLFRPYESQGIGAGGATGTFKLVAAASIVFMKSIARERSASALLRINAVDIKPCKRKFPASRARQRILINNVSFIHLAFNVPLRRASVPGGHGPL